MVQMRQNDFLVPGLLLVVYAFAVACGPALPTGRITQTWHPERSAPDRAEWDPLFLADSQFHNVTGAFIKSQSTVSALASAVAVRPSELNLLAPLVLGTALERYRASVKTHQGASVFYLGDSMNLACGSEAAKFQKTMESALPYGAGSVPWFIAPGNHDSFMSGMFNSFIPTDVELASPRFGTLVANVKHDGLSAPPNERSASGIIQPRPFYEFSWWTAESGRKFVYGTNHIEAGWPGVCAGDGPEAVPMNKLAWLAWYLQNQANQGIVLKKLGAETDQHDIEASGSIGDFSVTIKGKLHPPKSANELMNSWLSFIVQTVQLGDTAVALIDTSVGEEVGRAGVLNVRTTVGSVGTLGDEQADYLDQVLNGLVGVKRLIIAGHHPFKDLSEADQARLKKVMSDHGAITYFSAHTHAPTSKRAIAGTGLTEFNIGSTTDWPMEGGVARLSDASTPMRVFRTGSDCQLKYDRAAGPFSLKWRQACVHAPAAHKLATISESEAMSMLHSDAEWVSPKADDDCNLKVAAGSIERDMKIIERRLSNAKFKEFFLCLATQASSDQCGYGYDATCDSRLKEPLNSDLVR